MLSFAEVLWYVLCTINVDFNNETQDEIKRILNIDMNDSLCKCFTGRISRVINCLSSFSEMVNIKIKDESQIGNIIVMVKNTLGEDYTIDKHKEIVRKELLEREYDEEVIEKWIEYIE